MNPSIEVLRAEAKRLRSLADRMDAFAAELEGQPSGDADRQVRTATSSDSGPITQRNAKHGEFSGLTQREAIIKALKVYGPQTSRELFERLNAGGMAFKKPTYITALLPRLKDSVERTNDGKKLRSVANKAD